MINPAFLRTFVSLVETKHFTKTAEKLHMTQPGVTQHIKKLEQLLGKSLLTRFGKKFELTYAGECLYRYGVEQDQAEAELVHLLASDNKFQGECRLACSGSMAMQLYPKLLELQQSHTQLSINVESAPNSVILDRIRTNLSDIGLVTQAIDDPLLVTEKIGEDSLCLLLPKDWQSRWQDLISLGFINHPDGYHYANTLLALNYVEDFESAQKIPQSGYINQLSQILLPVSMGLGFTVLQQSAFESFADAGRIQIATLEHPLKEQVYLVRKKHRQLPARYELINELIASHWQ